MGFGGPLGRRARGVRAPWASPREALLAAGGGLGAAMSSSALRLPSSPLPPLPVTPTAEVWAEMSPAARERFIAEAGAALMAHQEAMGEGSPPRAGKGAGLAAAG